MWATFFHAIAYFTRSILTTTAILLPNYNLLFWDDYIGRIFFYAGAVFAIQIPLYWLFPKDKNRFILSYLAIVIGGILSVYQFFVRNIPTLNSAGFVNWHVSAILSGGMALILVAPWTATMIIFLIEFAKSKFKSLKPFYLGVGFFLISAGGLFQDMATNTFSYIFFSILLAAGFLLILAGVFYENN
jgi:hypothetical protein